ncbi:fungal-specific transcription factor domain-containing protein [Trichoderma compactum]
MSANDRESLSNNTPHRCRNRNVFAACQRCRYRKIRCDGSFPSCTNCQKAGEPCLDPHQEKEIPWSYVVSLEQKVKSLEAIIANRCPDIDLATVASVCQDADSSSSAPQVCQGAAIDTLLPEHGDSGRGHSTLSSPLATAAATSPWAPSRQAQSDTELLTHVIALVSLNGSSEPKYLGPSSGFSFAKLLASPGLRLDQQIHDADKLDAEAKALFRAECHAVPLPPFHEAAILAEAFFDEVQWQYPFPHKASFLSSLREVYNAKNQGQDECRPEIGSDAANIHTQVFLVLAVGASTLSKTSGMAVDVGNYYISAMQYSDRALHNVSLVTTQNHLLLAMYALFNPRSDTNIWFINYLLMASCIDLESLPKEAILKEEMRKRVFWSCYCLDRNVSTALGRPLGIRNEACDVPDFDINDTAELGADVRGRKSWSPISCSIHLSPTSSLSSGKASSPAHLEVSYHLAVMLLYHPSPRFPKLSMETARICSDSSIKVIEIFDSLQRLGKMQYSVLSVHSALLIGLTMIYSAQICRKKDAPEAIQRLPSNIRVCSSILSTMADLGWAHAKRSLSVFNIIGQVTLRYVQSAGALGTSETSHLHLNPMHERPLIVTLSNPLSQDSPPLDPTPMSLSLSNDQFMTTLGLENFPFEPLHGDGGIQTPNMALDITDWSSWETHTDLGIHFSLLDTFLCAFEEPPQMTGL